LSANSKQGGLLDSVVLFMALDGALDVVGLAHLKVTLAAAPPDQDVAVLVNHFVKELRAVEAVNGLHALDGDSQLHLALDLPHELRSRLLELGDSRLAGLTLEPGEEG